MTYYNTTKSTGEELGRFKFSAERQERLVLAYFRDRAWRGFTPSQVRLGMKTQAPLTSIRRAIANLTKEGLLRKSDLQAPGPYGRPEHIWTLPPANKPLPAQRRLL